MLREVQASEIWTTRSGSVERRDGWKKITDFLSGIQRPVFEVTARSVRERFGHLFQKRKATNREEEKASGISPEPSEVDLMMDELVELFETAASDQQAAVQEKKEKLAADMAKAQEMRQQSLGTMGESRKRKLNEDADENVEKKRKHSSRSETFLFLEEKIKLDTDMKERELDLKKKELEEKMRGRAMLLEEQRRKETGENQILPLLGQIMQQLRCQNDILSDLRRQQEQQGHLIAKILKNMNKDC